MQSKVIDVRYVAKLARIALTDDEAVKFSAELGDLLSHVDAISKLDTEHIAATAQVVTSCNVDRADEIGPCLSRDLVLSMAPRPQGPYFRVPRIIAREE